VILSAISNRRSIRRYKPDAVEAEKIAELMPGVAADPRSVRRGGEYSAE